MADTQNAVQIVCIEDEVEMIDLVKLILTRRGYIVHGADGGQAGLQMVKELRPDLVLLDLMMPDMDGWEVFRQMKADHETENIPVIIITAKAQNIDKILGLHIAKANDYITKPFGADELVQSIEVILGRRTQA